MKTTARITWHLEKEAWDGALDILAQLTEEFDIGFTAVQEWGISGGKIHSMVRIEHVMPDAAFRVTADDTRWTAEDLAHDVERYLQKATGEKCTTPVIDTVQLSRSCV